MRVVGEENVESPATFENGPYDINEGNRQFGAVNQDFIYSRPNGFYNPPKDMLETNIRPTFLHDQPAVEEIPEPSAIVTGRGPLTIDTNVPHVLDIYDAPQPRVVTIPGSAQSSIPSMSAGSGRRSDPQSAVSMNGIEGHIHQRRNNNHDELITQLQQRIGIYEDANTTGNVESLPPQQTQGGGPVRRNRERNTPYARLNPYAVIPAVQQDTVITKGKKRSRDPEEIFERPSDK